MTQGMIAAPATQTIVRIWRVVPKKNAPERRRQSM